MPQPSKPPITPARPGRRRASALAAAAIALLLGTPFTAADAQTFDQANSAAAARICSAGIATANLRLRVCQSPQLIAGAAPEVEGAGMLSSRNPAIISREQARLERIEAEKRQGSGGSADTGLGSGITAYVMTGATGVRGRASAYEESYDSHAVPLTLGIDIRVSQQVTAGIGFEFAHWTGGFAEGGGFRMDSYGPRLHLLYQPAPGSFVAVNAGYLRQDLTRSRFGIAFGNGATLASGLPEGRTAIDRWSATLLTGYDIQLGSLAIGPRLGLAAEWRDIGGYTERGSTGLELAYAGRQETVLQGAAGLAARVLTETRWGGLVTQLSALWLHQLVDSGRSVRARFVDAPDASAFTFLRAPAGRDAASLGLGVALVTNGPLQPFVQFAAVLGDPNATSYGGVVGLRRSW